jgi:hypothetical protein
MSVQKLEAQFEAQHLVDVKTNYPDPKILKVWEEKMFLGEDIIRRVLRPLESREEHKKSLPMDAVDKVNWDGIYTEYIVGRMATEQESKGMRAFMIRSIVTGQARGPFLDMVLSYVNEHYKVDYAGLTTYFEGDDTTESLAAWADFKKKKIDLFFRKRMHAKILLFFCKSNACMFVIH